MGDEKIREKRSAKAVPSDNQPVSRRPVQISNQMAVQMGKGPGSVMEYLGMLSNSSHVQELAGASGQGASGSSPLQRARGAGQKTDRKKEKWKAQGPKNWKHGRKQGADRKQPVWEPEQDPDIEPGEKEIAPPKAVVTEHLLGAGFSEADYVDMGVLLVSAYVDNPEIESFIDKLSGEEVAEKKFGAALEVIERQRDKILSHPEVKSVISKNGNCGGLANFLFLKEGDSTLKAADYQKFVQELRLDVGPGKVKLMQVTSNTVGHAFTLICYRQRDKVTVEMIQAWQGEYSVEASLGRGTGNLFTNQELAAKFDKLNRNMAEDEGLMVFRELFMIQKPKENETQFHVEKMDVKTLDMSPEDYAKELDRSSLKKIPL